MSALEQWKKSDKWVKNDGQYVEGAHRWLEKRPWEEEPPPVAKPAAEESPFTDGLGGTLDDMAGPPMTEEQLESYRRYAARAAAGLDPEGKD